VLALRIEFLNGTYHAAAPTAPQSPEWPPAPDRVFQALVAGAYGGGLDPAPLRVLEHHLPEISYGDALAAQGSTVFVPAAYRAKQGRVANYDPAMVAIADPVYFRWPSAPDALREPLATIAAHVDYLGRAKTPLSLSLVDEVPKLANRIVPSATGDELLGVPHQGRLDELDAAFAAGRRASVAGMAAYANARDTVPASPWGELLVLRPERNVSIHRAAQLAEALRAAALSVAGDGPSPSFTGMAAITPPGHLSDLPQIPR
jgi:CRISPR-associated protein Csb2